MGTDLVDRLDGAPEYRLTAYTYQKAFGRAPFGVWYVPGTITLLANGARRLTVATRRGSIVAAMPRPDGIIEPLRMSNPEERVTLTVDEAAAGRGPSWAREGLLAARTGATLLASTDLPDGSGLGSAAATQAALRLALHDLAVPQDSTALAEADGQDDDAQQGTATLDSQQLPFDLAAAGLRLVIIDTRVRDVPQPPAAERASMDAVTAVLSAGALRELGPMLTAAHAAMAPDEVQEVAVRAALDGGALGARMITDGPGRPVCALIAASELPDVRGTISRAFAARALRAPRVLTVTPGAYRPRRVA